jgi:hypothetical protein
VVGSVSVRNDPMGAVEEIVFSEAVDEIILSVAQHVLSTFAEPSPRRRRLFRPLTIASG